MRNLDGNENGIIETPKKSNEIECVVIGNQKTWIRKCPECNNDISTNDKWYCEDANRRQRLCKTCRISGNRNPNYGISVSSERKEKQRNTLAKRLPNDWYWYGKKLSEEHCENIAKTKRGRKLSLKHIEIIRNVNAGNTYAKGIKHTDETRCKLRIARANYAMRNAGTRICPAFNEIACDYFEWVNKWNGWNGRYATNGGEYFVKELGYFVDYYEPVENIVIEWDEPRHYKGDVLIEKDVYRMKQIKDHLKCRFFRINSKTNIITEY